MEAGPLNPMEPVPPVSCGSIAFLKVLHAQFFVLYFVLYLPSQFSGSTLQTQSSDLEQLLGSELLKKTFSEVYKALFTVRPKPLEKCREQWM